MYTHWPTDVSSQDDLIDSRNVLARIEELREELDAATDAQDQETYNDLFSELSSLQDLTHEANQHTSEWADGAILVRDSHFTQFARNEAEELYDIPTHWPFTCLDYELVAEQLQEDYTEILFDGVSYWLRTC